MRNHPHRAALIIGRALRDEAADRPISPRPGYFDADGLYFDGHSVQFYDNIGWVLQYCGARWSQPSGKRKTKYGVGVLLLDRQNPERVLYRSQAPIPGTDRECDGWEMRAAGYSVGMREDLVPQKVREEVRRIYSLRPMESDMTRWLKRKSSAG